MAHRLTALSLITLTLIVTACTAPRPESANSATASLRPSIDRFEHRIDSLRTAARIPGLSVAVLFDTTVILARGYGLADVENRIPATPETPYHIASVTKPISAVTALRLVEQGVLDLDRPMSSYEEWDEFCRDAKQAGGVFFDDFACDHPDLTLRHVLSMQANGQAPGERFFYNPISYSYASRPIMQVTGQAFSDLVAANVFRPAGMTHSARRHRNLPLPEDLAARVAKPYHLDSTGAVVPSPPPGPQGDGAAGGVVSTVLDLARFDVALTTGKLLTAASREMMWTPGRSPAGDVLPYGIGWFVQNYEGEPLLWHSGLWEGQYSALYLKAPARKMTLILLANSDGLWWGNAPDRAEVEKSAFAKAFLEEFP